MAAAAASVSAAEDDAKVEDLRNITQCSICQEAYQDPRILPCIHTFCLECLQKAGSKKRPEERMPCPLCRKEFIIPKDDFEGLQKDFRLQSLIEMSKLSPQIHQSAAAAGLGSVKDHEIFCFECQSAVSIRSYFDRHQLHDCSDIVKAIEKFRHQLIKDEEGALALESELQHRKNEAEEMKANFLNEVSRLERIVNRRGDDMRRLVDEHLLGLKGELSTLRQQKLEEIEAELDNFDKQLLATRRYSSRCSRLRSKEEKVIPSDLCRTALELHAEAGRMKMRYDSTCVNWKSHSLEINLKVTPLERFLTRSSNNIVGTLQANRNRSPSRSTFAVLRTPVVALWRMLCQTDITSRSSGGFGLLTAILVAVGFNVIAGVFAGLFAGFLLFGIIQALAPKTTCLRFMASLKTDNRHASGVTCLRHRIYVIVQSPSLIVVYQSQPPFTRLGEILAAEIGLPCDIASCDQTNVIYVTDSENRCVWKVIPDDGHISCWLSDMSRPHTMSVSSDGYVLIVRDSLPCSGLEVYGPDSVMLECIKLPVKIKQPHHAVETSTGTFLVSYGTWITQTHGLVELTRDGDVLRSHSSTESLWGILKSITLLLDQTIHSDDARHLALDADDMVFTGDWFNDRIIRFDSRFKLSQMYVTIDRTGAGWPIVRLCYVKETKQMMIVHETTKENRVHVYRLY